MTLEDVAMEMMTSTFVFTKEKAANQSKREVLLISEQIDCSHFKEGRKSKITSSTSCKVKKKWVSPSVEEIAFKPQPRPQKR